MSPRRGGSISGARPPAGSSSRRPLPALLFVSPVVLAGLAVLFLPRASGASRAVSSAAATTPDARFVYLRDCAVCHGADATGSQRGPSLFGAGSASVQYYLTTGRMPLGHPDEVPSRHPAHYPPATINALIDYIAQLTNHTGPPIPHIDLAHADLALGGELYRLNCAACHSWAGTGGALTTRQAPSLAHSTPQQIADAVRAGPGLMPIFGAAAISDPQLSDVVAAADYAAHPQNRGGLPLSHIGPLAEGAVAVFIGLGLLLLFTNWIGTKRV